MKIDFRDNNLIVFLNKKIISSIDFSDKEELERYFKDLFFRLSDEFDFDISGSYDIDVFIDNLYGVVLDIKKNDDFIDYCDIVDIKVSISKFSNFVYRVNDYMNYDFCNVYFYNNSFYLEPFSGDFYDIGFLVENSDIVYGKDAYDIRLYGKKLDGLFID